MQSIFAATAFLVFCSLSEISCAVKETEVIQTSSGPLKGIISELGRGERVRLFLGIPYAEPPIGDRRFKHALPKRPWKNTFVAAHFGPFCMQLTSEVFWMPTLVNNTRKLKNTVASNIDMNEDCLTLNVYTPDDGERKSFLPIMVFIHGGSYFMNSGNLYPGEKLASKGVVFVTMNYRLGVFGFLSTGNKLASGNFGLTDQILALKWIKENGGHFGGDVDRITISGNSAGASSAMLIALSRYSRDLFTKAIFLSGCGGAPWAVQQDPRQHFQHLARNIGCSGSDQSQILQCLCTFPANVLMKNITLGERFGGISFAPVIDGDILEKSPRQLIMQGRCRNLSVIMGFTKQEVSSWFVQSESVAFWMSSRSYLEVVIDDFVQHDSEKFLKKFALLPEERKSFSKLLQSALVAEYAPRNKRTNRLSDLLQAGAFISDVSLRIPCLKDLDLLTENSLNSAYLFEFDYYSSDDVKMRKFEWIGAYHESEIQYILGEPYLNYINTLRENIDKYMSDVMMEIILKFVNTGHPFPVENLPSWIPYNSEQRPYLLLSSNLSMKEKFFESKMDFWNTFLPTFFEHNIRNRKEKVCQNLNFYIIWSLVALCVLLMFSIIILLLRKNKNRFLCV